MFINMSFITFAWRVYIRVFLGRKRKLNEYNKVIVNPVEYQTDYRSTWYVNVFYKGVFASTLVLSGLNTLNYPSVRIATQLKNNTEHLKQTNTILKTRVQLIVCPC